jgi:predicted nuclease of predicted toxin-antitoxin system
MRFLADESCDFSAVRTLRAAGHSVVAVAETVQQAYDETVLSFALSDQQILLTEDKDFGQLVFSAGHATAGVLLLRFPATARANMAKAVLALVTERGEQLVGRFTVVQPGHVRIGLRYEG